MEYNANADGSIRVTLGDGSVVEGANLEEAFKNLAKMKEDTAQYAREQKEAREAAEGERDYLIQQQAQQPQQTRTPSPANGFNRDTYYTLLNEDPMAAQDYWFQCRFGSTPEQTINVFNQTYGAVQGMTREAVISRWSANHAEDYPYQDKAANQALTQRILQLEAAGHPFSPQTMDLAYMELVNAGVIKPNVPAQPAIKVEANPSLGGTRPQQFGPTEEDLWRMPMNQLEAHLKRQGAL